MRRIIFRTSVLSSIIGFWLVSCSAAIPGFTSLKLDGTFSEVAPGDFDEDNLQDLLMLDDFKLTICFQHGQQGFPPELQRSFELERRPSLISIANSPGSPVFVMVSDGVGELSFSNRTISFQQIIKGPTIVPAATEATNALMMNFCVKTLEGFPLLLIPTGAGLQVWRRTDAWRQTQLLQETVRNWVTPSVPDPGYETSFAVRLGVADINGDLREDLMIRQNQFGATNLYHLYLQQSGGSFG